MFTMNTDVTNGIANGSSCYLKSIHLKPHMEQNKLPRCCLDGYYVSVVSAAYVDHIVCRHVNNDETFVVTMEENTKVCVRLSLHDILDLPTSITEFQKTVMIQFTKYKTMFIVFSPCF